VISVKMQLQFSGIYGNLVNFPEFGHMVACPQKADD
jgi:hypothetical protein